MENWKAMEHLKYINAFTPQSVPNNLLKLTILLPQTARDFVQERLQNLSQNDFQMIRKEEVVFIWAFAVHYALEVEKAQNLALNSCAYSSGLHANAISMKASYVPLIPKWLERVLGDGDELPYDHDGKDDSGMFRFRPGNRRKRESKQKASHEKAVLTQTSTGRAGTADRGGAGSGAVHGPKFPHATYRLTPRKPETFSRCTGPQRSSGILGSSSSSSSSSS